MRAVLIACALLAGCASAGQESPGGTGDDQASGDDEPGPDGGPSGCNDVDNDGACQATDVCAGADDRVDSDNDTVPDGCDQCPGANDTIDANNDQTPDCAETMPAPLMTRTIPLKIVGGNAWRGRHGTQLANDSALDNTFTGTASSVGTLNSYMVFTLDGFTATTVESVTLRIAVVLYADPATYGATESLTVWDVTTPAATVESTNTVNPAIFQDLQSGTSYGTFTVTPANEGTVIEIPLNASAKTDVKAKIGQDFAVGFHLDTTDGYVLWSNSSEARIHELVITYRQ